MEGEFKRGDLFRHRQETPLIGPKNCHNMALFIIPMQCLFCVRETASRNFSRLVWRAWSWLHGILPERLPHSAMVEADCESVRRPGGLHMMKRWWFAAQMLIAVLFATAATAQDSSAPKSMPYVAVHDPQFISATDATFMNG